MIKTTAFPQASLKTLLQDFEIEPWLHQQFDSLNSIDTAFTRSAAVGLILRRWIGELKSPQAVLQARLRGIPSPKCNAKEWVKQLSQMEIKRLASEILQEASELADKLNQVPTIDDTMRSKTLLNLMQQRDILESTFVVSELLDFPETTRSLLSKQKDFLDNIGIAVLASIPFLEEESKIPIALLIVGIQEPNAWWGYATTKS